MTKLALMEASLKGQSSLIYWQIGQIGWILVNKESEGIGERDRNPQIKDPPANDLYSQEALGWMELSETLKPYDN